MKVANAGILERGGQLLSVKLRIVSRTRYRAHVHHAIRRVCLKQSDEFLDWRVEWPMVSTVGAGCGSFFCGLARTLLLLLMTVGLLMDNSALALIKSITP